MPGPKRTPTQIRLVKGNRSRRPLPKDEPKPKKIAPTVPSHLIDEAKVEWGRVSQELESLGLLTRIDRAALAAYCQAWARWVEAEKKIAAIGLVVKTPTKKVTTGVGKTRKIVESGGYPITNPYLPIANKALEQMHKFLTEFGMTPSSRTRIEVDPANLPKAAGAWNEF